MKIYLIAAVSAGGGIGKDGKIPWHLPEDLTRFKRITMGHTVVMGRRTYESIGRPLPDRTNVVITRNPSEMHAKNEMVRFVTMEDAEKLIAAQEDTVFVIGGSEIYRHFLGSADGVLLTRIDEAYECDAFFPLRETETDNTFVLTERSETRRSATGTCDAEYRFERYERSPSK